MTDLGVEEKGGKPCLPLTHTQLQSMPQSSLTIDVICLQGGSGGLLALAWPVKFFFRVNDRRKSIFRPLYIGRFFGNEHPNRIWASFSCEVSIFK